MRYLCTQISVVAEATALKSGMKVTITAAMAADGAMTATRIFAN